MNYKHGGARTREYRIWAHIKTRCLNPACRAYPDYGGRGITVCERWLASFSDFLSDMGKCPEGMSIERIDNNLGYSPNNCKWATAAEQARNKRSAHLLTIGAETRSITEWSEASGIKMRTIHNRLVLGWSPEDAVWVSTVHVRKGRSPNQPLHQSIGGTQNVRFSASPEMAETA